MIKLKIKCKNGILYSLVDKNNKEYKLVLNFLDIKEYPGQDDYIVISKELINPKYEGYLTSYTFGSLDSKYGKRDITLQDIDIIKVIINNKEKYLKRLYG